MVTHTYNPRLRPEDRHEFRSVWVILCIPSKPGLQCKHKTPANKRQKESNVGEGRREKEAMHGSPGSLAADSAI